MAGPLPRGHGVLQMFRQRVSVTRHAVISEAAETARHSAKAPPGGASQEKGGRAGPGPPVGGEAVPMGWVGSLCFLLGVGSGAVVVVFSCVREVNDPRYVGVTLGFHNLPVFLGFALMQWLTGVILDARWEGALAAGTRIYSLGAYRGAFALCLAVSAASLITACLVTETRCRNIWRTP